MKVNVLIPKIGCSYLYYLYHLITDLRTMMLPTIHFNLRRPKAVEPTNIYCVVYVGGKQIKFATSVKVKPKQWNKQKQLAIVSNVHSIVDNYNNNIVNKKISVMQQQFNRYLEYLCTTNNNDKPIHYFMEQKKTDFVSEITKADIENNKDVVKENTLIQHKTKLNAYIDYLKKCKPKNAFTQNGFDNYVQYLVDKGESNGSINGKVSYIRTLLNDIIKVNPQIHYKNRKDNRTDKGKVALNDDELKAIENLKIDDNKEYKYNYRKIIGSDLKQYRDMFILQCECGQRVSDLLQILKGEYEIKKYNNYEIIEVKTKKTKSDAYILINDKIRTLAERIKLPSEKMYNVALKIIAKEAKLNRIVEFTDAKHNAQSKPLYELLSSHYARHTFVTKLVRLGFDKNTIILFTGHKNIKMIDEVYLHATTEDKLRKIVNAVDKKKDVIQSDKKFDLLNDLFAYDKLKQLKELFDNNIINCDLYGAAATIIRDITLLDKAKSKYENEIKSKEQQLKLNAKVKEIGNLLFPLCKEFKDVETFKYFQYKTKVLNVIDKVDDDELLYCAMELI